MICRNSIQRFFLIFFFFGFFVTSSFFFVSSFRSVFSASPSDFILLVTPPSATASPGDTVVFSISALPLSSYSASNPIQLSVDSISSQVGVSANLSTDEILVHSSSTPGGSSSSTLTVSLSPSFSSSARVVFVTIQARNQDGIIHRAVATISVTRNSVVSKKTSSQVTSPIGDFVLTATPPSRIIYPGDDALFQIGATFLGSTSSDPVVLRVSDSGLPSGVTVSFGLRSTLDVSHATTSLSIHVDKKVKFTGPLFVTVTGTQGTTTHSVFAMVTIIGSNSIAKMNQADFSLIITPPGQKSTPGSSVDFIVSSVFQGGFQGSIDLSVPTDLPDGVTASVFPLRISDHATATLRVSLASFVRDSYIPISLTGVSGATKHTARAVVFLDAVSLKSEDISSDFILSVTPSIQSVQLPQSASFVVSVIPVRSSPAITNSVRLSLIPNGIASGVQYTFSPSNLSLSNSSSTPHPTSTLKISLAPTGGRSSNFSFVVQGKNDSGVTHNAAIHLSVKPNSPSTSNSQDSHISILSIDNTKKSLSSNTISAETHLPPPSHLPVACQKLILPIHTSDPEALDSFVEVSPGVDSVVFEDDSITNASQNQSSYSQSTNLVLAIQKIKENGVQIFGVVHTAGGYRDPRKVQDDVGAYVARYPQLDGIVFADAPTDSTQISFYASLASFVHNVQKKQVILATNGFPDEGYFRLADRIIIFEGDFSSYTTLSVPESIWQQKSNKIIHLVYAVSNLENALRAFSVGSYSNAGFVGVSSAFFGERWQYVPSYFSLLKEKLRMQCSASPKVLGAFSDPFNPSSYSVSSNPVQKLQDLLSNITSFLLKK